MANVHRRGNQLGPVMVDGVRLSSEAEICAGVADFYRRLFQEEGGPRWRPGVDELDFDVLSEDERVFLERPFSEEEVVAVLKEFKGDKAPGPDGFTMAFFLKTLLGSGER